MKSYKPEPCDLSHVSSRVRTHGLVAGLLAVIPAVVVWVVTLPAGVRRSFAFNYQTPTLVTAYTAHFVHLTVEHLVSNLVAYLVIVGAGYALAVQTGRRESYLVGYAATVFALPVVLSMANLLFPRPGVTYGLSGVVMGLLALLALELFAYVDQATGSRIGWENAAAVFFLDVGLMAAAVRPRTRLTVGIAAATGVLLVGYAGVMVRRVELEWAGTSDGVAIAAVAAVLLVAFPFVAFPSDPVGAGTVTNLLGHFLGFALAFIAAYLRPVVEARIDSLIGDASTG